MRGVKKCARGGVQNLMTVKYGNKGGRKGGGQPLRLVTWWLLRGQRGAQPLGVGDLVDVGLVFWDRTHRQSGI